MWRNELNTRAALARLVAGRRAAYRRALDAGGKAGVTAATRDLLALVNLWALVQGE